VAKPLVQFVDTCRAVQLLWSQHIMQALSTKLQPLLLSAETLHSARSVPADIVLERPNLLLGQWGTLSPLPSFKRLPTSQPDSIEQARARRFLKRPVQAGVNDP
jgi:hypothetical protein